MPLASGIVANMSWKKFKCHYLLEKSEQGGLCEAIKEHWKQITIANKRARAEVKIITESVRSRFTSDYISSQKFVKRNWTYHINQWYNSASNSKSTFEIDQRMRCWYSWFHFELMVHLQFLNIRIVLIWISTKGSFLCTWICPYWYRKRIKAHCYWCWY